VSHVGLEAIERQNDPAVGRGDLLETARISQGERPKFLVALQKMLDSPGGNGHGPSHQRLRELGKTPVLGIAPGANQGNHVEAKFMLGERPPSRLLRPVGLLKLRAGWAEAAPYWEREAHNSGQRRDRPVVVLGRPHRVATGGAVAHERDEGLGCGRVWPRRGTCHRRLLHEWVHPWYRHIPGQT
jgi:hypothetical protein